MSRIHEAIRKAERENRQEQPSQLPDENQQIGMSPIRSLGPSVPRQQSKKGSEQQRLVPERVEQESPFGEVSALPIPENSRLVSVLAPKSIPSEQYRTLKTKLYQLRKGGRIKTLLITSAGPSEGKTLTAVNLALTIAQEIDQRVLLIDGDLRKPSVHSVLGLSREKGLADLLEGKVSQEEVILASRIPNFYVTPAGTIPERPAELLNTQSMRDFLASAADRFDWVILDSPPIVPLADAELMSAFVDGVLLVVRAYHTPTTLIKKTVQTLQGKNLLGVVFNGIDKSKGSKYDYYYSYGSKN